MESLSSAAEPPVDKSTPEKSSESPTNLYHVELALYSDTGDGRLPRRLSIEGLTLQDGFGIFQEACALLLRIASRVQLDGDFPNGTK